MFVIRFSLFLKSRYRTKWRHRGLRGKWSRILSPLVPKSLTFEGGQLKCFYNCVTSFMATRNLARLKKRCSIKYFHLTELIISHQSKCGFDRSAKKHFPIVNWWPQSIYCKSGKKLNRIFNLLMNKHDVKWKHMNKYLSVYNFVRGLKMYFLYFPKM